MNSLPFSIGTFNPTNHLFTNRLVELPSRNKNLLILDSSTTLKSNETKYPNTNSASLSRREAVGFGFCFSFLQLVIPQPYPAAAAAEGGAAAPCQFTEAPSGLAYCDKVVGFGPEAVKGQLIKAHYVGKLESGKVFDSSYNRGKPLTFRVGVGEVIKGWDEGIIGGDGIPAMLAGKRELRIPPALGYGIRGAGCNGGSCIIPPNSVLVFDVELIGKA
ncbi:hypothetical protein ACP275_01G040900 [Erythranthe tilingii]